MKCLRGAEAPVSCWEQTTPVTVVRLEALITPCQKQEGAGPTVTPSVRQGLGPRGLAPKGFISLRPVCEEEKSRNRLAAFASSLPYLTRRSLGANAQLMIRLSPESTELPTSSL